MVEAHYKMAAVVRLTGIPANTLRTWERRYNIIQPDRSPGGARLYREDDITRLQLISALLDLGESIGTLTDLATDELRSRLSMHRRADAEATASSTSAAIAVFGQGLAAQLRAAPDDRFEITVPFDGGGVTEFLESPTRVDVLLIKLSVLGDAPISSFRQLMDASGARLGLIVYDFAPNSILWRLSDAGARLVKGPTRIASILQVVQDHLDLDIVRKANKPFPPPAPDDIRPERFFSAAQLGWLKEARNGIECECPNHLASLIEALNAFEDYSAHCENRDEDDAILHNSLALGSAQARYGLENLLQSVIESDNLDVPDV